MNDLRVETNRNNLQEIYDAAYTVAEACMPDLEYGTLEESNELPFRCLFYPTLEDFEAREAYFAELERKNTEHNLQYSEERWFQDEVQKTLRMLFETEFAEFVQ